MVLAAAMRGKTRGRIQIGADDPSLTAAGGMLAVTELCERLGLIAALDEGMGPVKQRRRGSPAGRCWPGWPPRSWPGRTSWWAWTGSRRPGRAAGDTGAGPGHLDRDRDRAPVHRRALAGRGGRPRGGDGADGELAAGGADGRAGRRPGDDRHRRHRRGGLRQQEARGGLQLPGAAGLAACTWPPGPKPRSRWPLACWPATRTPCSHVTGLLGRALAALPQAVRDGAAAAGRKIALRADAGARPQPNQ